MSARLGLGLSATMTALADPTADTEFARFIKSPRAAPSPRSPRAGSPRSPRGRAGTPERRREVATKSAALPSDMQWQENFTEFQSRAVLLVGRITTTDGGFLGAGSVDRVFGAWKSIATDLDAHGLRWSSNVFIIVHLGRDVGEETADERARAFARAAVEMREAVHREQAQLAAEALMPVRGSQANVRQRTTRHAMMARASITGVANVLEESASKSFFGKVALTSGPLFVTYSNDSARFVTQLSGDAFDRSLALVAPPPSPDDAPAGSVVDHEGGGRLVVVGGGGFRRRRQRLRR